MTADLTPASPDDLTPAPDELPPEVAVETLFVIEAGVGKLVIAPVGGGDVLEIPFSRNDARQLLAALAEYAYPGCTLHSTPVAGTA